MDAVGSVNADRRPDFREDILQDRFQNVTCESCDDTFRLQPKFNYLDAGRRQWIAALPSAQMLDWIEAEAEVADLFEQSYGKIWINGIDTQEEREELQGLIGYLPQEASVFRKLTVRENILAILEGMGMKKKAQARHNTEKKKILKNLEGIREMNELPACLVVVDPRHEQIAVAEANKMRIPVVALLDTDCDPDVVDLPIPGNDDAMRSVRLVLDRLADAVEEGVKAWGLVVAEREKIEAERRKEEDAKRAAEEQRKRVTAEWQKKLRDEADKRRRVDAPPKTETPPPADPPADSGEAKPS